MELTLEQIAEFDDRGLLVFPGLLQPQEVAQLTVRLPELYSRTGPEVVREKQSNNIRLVYGTHDFCKPFSHLSKLPRLLNPMRQLLRGEAYLHQSRLNPKLGFSGGAWNWHQDFGTWHREDGMPEPHCVMTAVLLHKATAVNGPLLVIPGTHKLGMSEDVRPEADAKGYTVMEINESVVTDLAGKQGLEPVMGSAGTVAFIHCNLIHGSASNVSPWPRAIIYLNYNLVSNRPTGGNQRAWFHNNPNPAPLEVGSDQALAA